MLTVGVLRDLIKDLDEDIPVVIGHEDHSYYQAHMEITEAEKISNTDYSEFFSKEDMTDQNNSVVTVLVIQ